jgi:hypothetical protein
MRAVGAHGFFYCSGKKFSSTPGAEVAGLLVAIAVLPI